MFEKVLVTLCACVVLSFSSCEKMVLDDSDLASDLVENSAKLTIVTRSDDSFDDSFTLQTRIYIFNRTGICVQMLTTDGDDNTITTQLASGTYTLYAVGGNDLDRFTLPAQSEATATSIISLKENKVMDSFFIGDPVSITLRESEDANKSITLNRMVTCLNKIEIKDVPKEVTGVKVILSPFHSAVQLDGTFLSPSPVYCEISLTEQNDGTTWKATPNQLLFPSIGEPTVIISFTTEDGTNAYSYTMSEPMEANHYYSLSGTYKSSKARLSITMTVTNWGEEHNIDFDFSDTDTAFPVSGQYYKGYYVISVNEQEQTAVLLSEHIPYNAPSDLTEASLWRSEIEARMAALEKPANITNNWRLPTVKEVEIFTKDPNAVTFTEDGYSPVCFCEDDKGNLVWAYTKKDNENGTYTFVPSGSNTTYKNNLRLRPVIDITY